MKLHPKNSINRVHSHKGLALISQYPHLQDENQVKISTHLFFVVLVDCCLSEGSMSWSLRINVSDFALILEETLLSVTSFTSFDFSGVFLGFTCACAKALTMSLLLVLCLLSEVSASFFFPKVSLSCAVFVSMSLDLPKNSFGWFWARSNSFSFGDLTKKS